MSLLKAGLQSRERSEQQRVISLKSHASKVAQNMLKMRSSKRITDSIKQDQFGFINRGGVGEKIAVMRILAKR